MSEEARATEGVVNKARMYMYYIIIGIVSFIALVFLPMLGTAVDLAWAIPETPVGWIVWTVTKLIMSAVNILIFHSFVCQGKLNIRDDPHYKEAVKILGNVREKNYVPRSPKKFLSQEYGKKGVTIFILTALSTVALTQAILTFDWVSMLTYLFTIIMGVIFGVLEMKRVEEFWTGEFYDYAKDVERQQSKQKAILSD